MNLPITIEELKKIVIPVLDLVGLNNGASARLLYGTCAQESKMGKYRRQIGYSMKSTKGAFGIFQMEIFTHNYLVTKFLQNHEELKGKIRSLYNLELTPTENLMLNDRYAVAMARLKYYSCPFAMPEENAPIEQLAHIWNKWYNANAQHGTDEEFISNYRKYINV